MDEQNMQAEVSVPSGINVSIDQALEEYTKYCTSLTHDLMVNRAGIIRAENLLMQKNAEIGEYKHQMSLLRERLGQQEAFAVEQQMVIDAYVSKFGHSVKNAVEDQISDQKPE